MRPTMIVMCLTLFLTACSIFSLFLTRVVLGRNSITVFGVVLLVVALACVWWLVKIALAYVRGEGHKFR